MEANRSVFANPTPERVAAPVVELQSRGQRLNDLQNLAERMAANYPLGLAASVAGAMLIPGAAYAYLNGGSPLGTISAVSAQREAAANRTDLQTNTVTPGNGAPLSLANAAGVVPLGAPGSQAGLGTQSISGAPGLAAQPVAGVSNQSAFAARSDAALSPVVQAALIKEALRYNPTLAHSWEESKRALGFVAPGFSPETVAEQVAAVVIAPHRKLGLSSPTSAPDVKPRLVYPGFAQRQLTEMAAARRRGGLLSVFADNSTGIRAFGGTLSTTASTSTSRIPTGLTRLLTREIISNGLDANGETNSAAASNTPAVSGVNLVSSDPDNHKGATPPAATVTTEPASSSLVAAAPSIMPVDRTKTVAV
jgi:hypothetical protein